MSYYVTELTDTLPFEWGLYYCIAFICMLLWQRLTQVHVPHGVNHRHDFQM